MYYGRLPEGMEMEMFLFLTAIPLNTQNFLYPIVDVESKFSG